MFLTARRGGVRPHTFCSVTPLSLSLGTAADWWEQGNEDPAATRRLPPSRHFHEGAACPCFRSLPRREALVERARAHQCRAGPSAATPRRAPGVRRLRHRHSGPCKAYDQRLHAADGSSRAWPQGRREGQPLTAELLDGGPLLGLLPGLRQLLVPGPHGLQQQADTVLQEARPEGSNWLCLQWTDS